MVDPEKTLAEAVEQGAFPGAQLVYGIEDRATSLCAGWLKPGGPSVHPSTVYDLASLTKPLVTAVLLFQKVEQGLCKLEDSLSRFIPNAPDVRLLDLLEHSAGFPAHLRLDRPYATRASIIEEAVSTPLEAAPGERAKYSDLGFIALGAALEVMGGRLDQQWALLGIPGLDFCPGPSSNTAPTEGDLVGVVHDENARAMEGVAGHAGLFGSALSVYRFTAQLVSIFRGQASFLSPDSVRRMWQPSSVPHSSRTPGWDRPTPPSSTGRFWPQSAVGHLGFTGTSVWIEPQLGLIAVLVSNRVWPTRDNQKIRTIRPAVHDAIWEKLAPETATQ